MAARPSRRGRGDDDDDDDGEEEKVGKQSAGEVPVIKFPRTRHLMDLGSASRDDLLMDKRDVDAFLAAGDLVVEEKIDGANLGISLDRTTGALRVQNRAHFVNSASATQFRGLDAWAQANPAVYDVLCPADGDGHELVLFGEWMAVKHSIHYTRLPGYFVAFDIFDVYARRFFSVAERNRRLTDSNIPVVPLIARGSFSRVCLSPSLSLSTFIPLPQVSCYAQSTMSTA